MVEFMRTGGRTQVRELLQHPLREGLQTRQFEQGLVLIHRDRHTQDAGGTRVGRLDGALGIQHDHPGGEVVQDGLQVASCRIELLEASVHGCSGI